VAGISAATGIGSSDYGNYCATLADGNTQCWGRAYEGEFGNGQVNTMSYLPVAGGFSGVQSFSGGNNFSCAGYNGYDQLGMGIAKFLALATDIVGGLVFWK